MADDIPTTKDWDWTIKPPRLSDVDDAPLCEERFIGRSRHDMVPFFRDSPITASAFLRLMPPVPFQYYVLTYRLLFMPESNLRELEQNIDFRLAADCFLSVLKRQLESSPDFILPVIEELIPVAEALARYQQTFDSTFPVKTREIYGCFSERLSEIRKLVTLAQSAKDSGK